MMSFIGIFCKLFKAYWSYLIFTLLVVAGWVSYITQADRAIHKWIMKYQSTAQAPHLQKLYGYLSDIGQLEFKVAIALIMMGYYTWRNYQPQLRLFWWRALLLVSAIGALIIPLKRLFGRPRPKMEWRDMYEMEWFEFASNMHSFPSGHATTTWAFFFVLYKFWPKYTPVWLVYALSASYARMGIGAHYLGDVLVGSAIGFFMAYWFWPKVMPDHLLNRIEK